MPDRMPTLDFEDDLATSKLALVVICAAGLANLVSGIDHSRRQGANFVA